MSRWSVTFYFDFDSSSNPYYAMPPEWDWAQLLYAFTDADTVIDWSTFTVEQEEA